MKKIELLDFNETKNDLYIDTMKLINKEIDDKQMIRSHLYYEMVKSIYIANLKKLEDIPIDPPEKFINLYIDNATDTYNKIRDLNKYVGYDYKPFDDESIYYISTQYINYFNINDIDIKENITSFAKKIAENIKEYRHHPFIRIKSNTYNVEQIEGINIDLNDLIYKSLKTNLDIINNIKIKKEDLIDIRRGNVRITKDILYMMFLGLQLSKFEIEQFIKKIDKNKYSFNTKRDQAIIKIINDINAYKSIDKENKSLLDITNELLHQKGLREINKTIIKKEEKDNSKSLLLIGGFGFIGRECIDYFQKNKFKTFVLVKNIPTSIPSNVICYRGDITNKLVYERILSENEIDYIINLAAISTVNKGDKAFQETMLINEQAPNALYSSIIENDFNVKSVIFPSTTQVYQGLAENEDIALEDSFINPQKIGANYPFSKYQAEQNSLRFINMGVPIVITRLSNIYGIEDNNDRLIPKAIRSLEKGEEATLYVDSNDNNKTALINLVYIKDLLRAFQKIFEKADAKEIDYYKKIIVNIASREEYTVKEILEKLYKIYGREFNPIIKTCNVGKNYTIDTNKAYNQFGFKSEYSLEDGLNDMFKNKEKVKKIGGKDGN